MTTNVHDVRLVPLGAPSKDADARKRSRARRRLGVRLLTGFFAVLLAGGAVLAGWPKPLAVEEAAVRKGSLEVTIDEAGKTRVRDRFIVHAPLGGDLARVTLRPGDAIERDAALAAIFPASPALLDPRARAEAKARVEGAEAAVAQAAVEVARAETTAERANGDLETTRRLLASGAVPPEQLRHDELDSRLRAQELAAARFASKVALHEVEVARSALLRYGDQGGARQSFTVPSPVSGRVLRVLHESAGVVAPGTPLLEVGNPTSLEVVVDVLTADAVGIQAGAPVRLERWGGDKPLDAHVRLVEPSAFTKLSALGVEEQRVSVVVDIDDPPAVWERLGDGFRVEARIVTWRRDGVVLAPASAAFRRGDGWAVFVDAGGRALERAVEIGHRGALEVEVLSGLSDGERVIVHPSGAVSGGSRVQAQ